LPVSDRGDLEQFVELSWQLLAEVGHEHLGVVVSIRRIKAEKNLLRSSLLFLVFLSGIRLKLGNRLLRGLLE